jgi:hypothetical protein
MIAIRKFGYSALLLAAFAGCTQEQPAPAPAPTPGTPSDTKAEPTDIKPAPAPEPTDAKPAPAPAPTPDEKAAPSDAPKVEAPAPSPAPKDKEKEKEEEKPDAKAEAVTLEPDEIAEIKKLPPAQAEAALKQAVCPVSDEHLGSMGVPVRVTAQGHTFFLCCKNCNKDVKEKPAEVVAKLKK